MDVNLSWQKVIFQQMKIRRIYKGNEGLKSTTCGFHTCVRKTVQLSSRFQRCPCLNTVHNPELLSLSLWIKVQKDSLIIFDSSCHGNTLFHWESLASCFLPYTNRSFVSISYHKAYYILSLSHPTLQGTPFLFRKHLKPKIAL